MPLKSRRHRLHRGRGARAGHIVLVALLVVGSLGVIAGSGALTLLGARFDAQRTVLADAFPAETLRPPVAAGPTSAAQNILLIGAVPAEVAASEVPVSADRFTSMMLVHAPADRRSLQIMSVLSDTEVALPGETAAPFTELLSEGGVPAVVLGVEHLLGVRMDRVAVVNLAGVSTITDLLGGISLFNGLGMMSLGPDRHYFALDVLTLNGPQALDYVAGDFAVVDSDYRRALSQQTYASAVLSAVRTDLVQNPLLLTELLDLAADHLAADEGLTACYLTALTAQLVRVRGSDTAFFLLPTSFAPGTVDTPPVRVPHPDKIGSVRSAFQTDVFDPDYWNPTPAQSRIND